MVASANAYEKIFVKLVSYTYRRTCDINYCSVFSNMVEPTIKDIVTTWCNLNEESYNIRYKDDDKARLSDFLKLHYSGETINTYQALKTLEFINYNIEPETIEEKRNLNEKEKQYIQILKRAISEIKNTIINQIPEYNAAKWSL